jgi:hypothetical protein
MKILFLRGSVPPKDEHPEKLYYNNIDSCEDMWTQLFYFFAKKNNATAEMLYWGGNRKFIVSDFFTEKWVPSFKTYLDFTPDLIFCRGGFDFYDDLLVRYPRAKKIYYGAGKRYFCTTKFTDYNLFLVDSVRQLKFVRDRGKNVELFIKPAATLFRPIKKEKIYDVCVSVSYSADRKRYDLLLKAFAGSKYKILNLGNVDKKYVDLARKMKVNIKWDGWSLRKFLPDKIAQCRVGLCCSDRNDSTPRVIPEFLACDVPVVVTDDVNIWNDKYINSHTGVFVKDDNILDGVKKVLNGKFSPRKYYDENLSIKCSVEHLNKIIANIL